MEKSESEDKEINFEALYNSLGIECKLKSFSNTCASYVYTFNVTSCDCDKNKIRKATEKIGVFISRKLTLKFEEDGRGAFSISIDKETRDFPKFFDYSGHLQGMESGTFLLGLDDKGKIATCNICDTKSILIGGASGGGKSVAMHVLINSLLQNEHEDDINIAMIDLKKCEFARYEGLYQIKYPIATTYGEAIALLRTINAEIDRRYNIMRKNKINKASVKDFPILVTFVDEYALLTSSGEQKVVDGLVGRIASIGRAANAYIIIATQHAVNKVISNTIRSNLQSRIGLRAMNNAQSQAIIGGRGLIDLRGYGDSLIQIDGIAGYKRVQIFNIKDSEIDNLIDKAKIVKRDSGKDEPKTKVGSIFNKIGLLMFGWLFKSAGVM